MLDQIVDILSLTFAYLFCAFFVMLVASAIIAYAPGDLDQRLKELLEDEIGVRLADGMQELSVKNWARLTQHLKAHSNAEGLSDNQGYIDKALATFSGRDDDPNFYSTLLHRRSEAQQRFMDEVASKCERVSMANDLVKRWRAWILINRIQLYWLGVYEYGPAIFRHVLSIALKATGAATIAMVVFSVFVWLLALGRRVDQESLLAFVGNAANLGLLVGLLITCFLLCKRFFGQLLHVASVKERRSVRTTIILIPLSMLCAGLSIYYRPDEYLQVWFTNLWMEVKPSIAIAQGFIFLVMILFLLRGGYITMRNSFVSFLLLSQRLDELSASLLAFTLAASVAVIAPSAIQDDQNLSLLTQRLLFIVTMSGFSLSGLLVLAAQVARVRERRARYRRYRELGLTLPSGPSVLLLSITWLGCILLLSLLIEVVPSVASSDSYVLNVTLVALEIVIALALILVLFSGPVVLIVFLRRRKAAEKQIAEEYYKRSSRSMNRRATGTVWPVY